MANMNIIKNVAASLLLIYSTYLSLNTIAIAENSGNLPIDLSLVSIDMPHSSVSGEKIIVNVIIQNERNNEVEVASIKMRAYRNNGTNTMILPVGEGVVTGLEPLSQKTIVVYGKAPRVSGEWEIVTEITIREDIGKDINLSNNKRTTFITVN